MTTARKKRNNVQLYNGDSFKVPLDEPFYLECCDCGKVDKFRATVRNGKLILRVWKMEGMTLEARRKEEALLQREWDKGWTMLHRRQVKEVNG